MFTKDFENWLDQQAVAPYKAIFNDIPLEVQYAYIENFAFEKGYTIEINYERNTKQYFANILFTEKNLRVDISNNIKTPIKIKTEIINKLKQLYNERI